MIDRASALCYTKFIDHVVNIYLHRRIFVNRDEKNEQTRNKIIDSALVEFGEKPYAQASLNTVCAAGNISKGIIYHYFKDKDELYLFCVKACFDALTTYLSGVDIGRDTPIAPALERYFDARTAFFAQNPLYLGVFCNAVMDAPTHLCAEISAIRKGLDAQSISFLTAMLQTVKLRADVTIPEVIAVFCEYQDFVNARFQKKALGAEMLKAHEMRCRRSLRILLYGVIANDTD